MAGGAKNDSKASSSKANASTFGSLPKATGFLRRGTPKSSSKATSPVLSRSESEEGRLPWPAGADEFQDPLRKTSIGDDGLSDSGYGLSRSESARTQSSISHASTSPPSDVMDMRRRGSAVSASSLSHSPPSPVGGPSQSRINRTSLSSFASSSGSPLATASSFSDRTTIGDLSTASMPLLPGGGGGSSSSKFHDSSSAASFSDASSVHSYPPPPRPRRTTSSTRGSNEGGSALDGWKRWARELEAASAPPDRVRRVSGMGNDVPLGVYASRSGSTTSLSYSRTHASSTSSLNQPSQLSFASAPLINRTTTTASLNPLAPLRKRLARSLNSGRRARVELQLLLELIDALEHYIKSAEAHPQQAPAAPSSSSASASTSSLFLEPTTPSPPSAAVLPLGPAPSPETDVELLAEIRSLVKELVECVPDAQLCLTTGLYGPLAFPSSALSHSATTYHHGGPAARTGITFSSNWPIMPLSTTSSMVLMDLRDSETLEWWPRRLARDCRGLLEEVGFALGATPTSSLTPGYREGGASGAGQAEGLPMGLGVEGGPEGEARTSLEEALGVVRAAGERNAGVAARRDTKAAAARREELLVEGKKRWEAYRRRQAAQPGAFDEGSPSLDS